MSRRNKYNNMRFGTAVGLLTPLVVLLIFYLLNVSRFGGHEQLMRYIVTVKVYTAILSLCVIPNLLLFFVLVWKNLLYAARGVILATFIFAFVIIGLKVL